MFKTFKFYEALGDVSDLEREYGNKGAGSLYCSIRTFATAYATAELAGLSVKPVSAQDDILDLGRDAWPSYLQPAAAAIEEDVQFVHDVIMNVAADEDEEERLKAALKNAIREDLKAAIDEAKQEVKKAA